MNNLQFIEFQNQLSEYCVFSLNDILKIFPDFKRIQLDRWEKKGYLRKIKRSYYCFFNQGLNRDFLFCAANKIYAPSYVSLEMALKFYGLIPEEVFQITSVSTKKIAVFETDIGNFSYRHIKPSLYWGYRLVTFGKQKILIADPEKAVLDYLYVHPNLKTAADFEGIRINTDEFKNRITPQKLYSYLDTFGNKALTKRARIFLTTIHNDNT